jgi:hypothetical protein
MMNEAAPSRIKIGLSIDVDNRTDQMSFATASPGDVETLIAVQVTSMEWLERELHSRFAYARVATKRGLREWFEISPDPVLREIRTIASTQEGMSRIMSVDVRYSPGSHLDKIKPRTSPADMDCPIMAALIDQGIPTDRIKDHSVIMGLLRARSGATSYLITPPAYLCPRTDKPLLSPVLRALSLYWEIRSGQQSISTTRSALDRLYTGRCASQMLFPLEKALSVEDHFIMADPELLVRPNYRDAICSHHI